MDEHQAKLVAQALGELLVASGYINDVPLTGPELLMHAEMLTRDLASGHLLITEDSDGVL